MANASHIKLKNKITIPVSELLFQFTTSSGPGGQHANRSATRVTLLFDVANSPSLDDASRIRIQENLAHRLDKEGVLQIHVQDSRSQKRNRDIALSRLKRLLSEALVEPKERIKTTPSPVKIEQRKKEKEKLSRRKKERRKNWSEEL